MLKLYRHVAAVQMLVAPVRCQSQRSGSAGRAAAEALTVRRANIVVLENMMPDVRFRFRGLIVGCVEGLQMLKDADGAVPIGGLTTPYNLFELSKTSASSLPPNPMVAKSSCRQQMRSWPCLIISHRAQKPASVVPMQRQVVPQDAMIQDHIDGMAAQVRHFHDH